jgi:hypothetical protein
MMISALLCSCGRGGQTIADKTLEIRTAIIAATEITATATVTADYGDRVYAFSLDYAGGDTGGDITVLAPPEIAGVTARVSGGDGVSLTYDGATLDTGVLADGETTPMSVIPQLIAQWKTGFVTSGVAERYGERDALAMTTDLSDTVSQKTWFDRETNLPICSEIISDGNLILSVTFEKVTLGGNT